MAKYGLRNMTGFAYMVGATSVGNGSVFVFWDSIAGAAFEVPALRVLAFETPTPDATLSALLITSKFIFTIDGIDKTSEEFWSFWNSWYGYSTGYVPVSGNETSVAPDYLPDIKAQRSGTCIIDFGKYPGNYQTTYVVSGQSLITASHTATAVIQYMATANYSADEVAWLATLIQLSTSPCIASQGFTIQARSTEKMQGQFVVSWAW